MIVIVHTLIMKTSLWIKNFSGDPYFNLRIIDLFTDASSLLVEFLGTMKPILYTFRENTYSLVNQQLLPAFEKASTWAEIEEFLVMISSGNDKNLDERRAVINNVMPNFGKNIGKLVKDICLRDLTLEITTSVNRIID